MPVAMAICMHMASYHDRGRRGCRCIGLPPFDARGLFAIAFGHSAHGAMSMPQVRVRYRWCDSCSAFLLSTHPLVSLGWPHYAWPGLAWPNFPSLKVHGQGAIALSHVDDMSRCPRCAKSVLPSMSTCKWQWPPFGEQHATPTPV